tara:strand:- start:1852 stop:2025 length:174 start_codon:yes stop_codon:yes gene_type:complete
MKNWFLDIIKNALSLALGGILFLVFLWVTLFTIDTNWNFFSFLDYNSSSSYENRSSD